MNFDLVNLQQRVNEAYNGEVHFISTLEPPPPPTIPRPNVHSINMSHQAVSKETKWGIKGKVSGKG